MRRIMVVVVGLALVAGAPSADAQTRVGIGVGLSSSAVGGGDLFDAVETSLSPVSIFVPFTGRRFRVEPEFGIFRASQDNGADETTASAVQVGVGVMALNTTRNVISYFGGRVGITRFSSETEVAGTETDTELTNFFVGPVLGGEYVFGDGFSLGGEAQLLYTKVGEDDDAPSGTSQSLIRTRALFFVRWRP
jgi:hypothetical protein